MCSGKYERFSGDGGVRLLWYFGIGPMSTSSQSFTSGISLYLNWKHSDLESFPIYSESVARALVGSES